MLWRYIWSMNTMLYGLSSLHRTTFSISKPHQMFARFKSWVIDHVNFILDLAIEENILHYYFNVNVTLSLLQLFARFKSWVIDYVNFILDLAIEENTLQDYLMQMSLFRCYNCLLDSKPSDWLCKLHPWISPSRKTFFKTILMQMSLFRCTIVIAFHITVKFSIGVKVSSSFMSWVYVYPIGYSSSLKLVDCVIHVVFALEHPMETYLLLFRLEGWE